MKTRIIKRTVPDGRIMYVIQQTHFLFFWWWVDAWINSGMGTYCIDSFRTLKEARANICYFDKSQNKEEVIEIYE